jgi:hypothetical protein
MRAGAPCSGLKVKAAGLSRAGEELDPGTNQSPLALLRAWCLLADKAEAHLAEIYADAPVAARITPVGFAWLPTLPPIHEDLDDPLGFLRRKVLAQKR